MDKRYVQRIKDYNSEDEYLREAYIGLTRRYARLLENRRWAQRHPVRFMISILGHRYIKRDIKVND